MAKKVSRTFEEGIGYKVNYAVYDGGMFTVHAGIIALTSAKENPAEIAREYFGENICIMSITPCKFVAKQALKFFIENSEITFGEDDDTEDEQAE